MNSQQNLRGEALIVGLRDGNQTVAASDYTKVRRIFITGVDVAGRILFLPTVAGLKNHVSDRDNAYPVTVQIGTTTVIVNPGEVKTLETDGTANGLSDETGSPALEGFSDETPLPDSGTGDPGSSVYPARSDHVHPTAASAVTSVAGRSGDVVLGESDIANLTSDLANLVATDGALNANKVAKGGDTMTGPLILPGSPTQDLHAATKAYVDAVAQGLRVKTSVKAVAQSNITLSGAQTIDGVAITAGMRVLAIGQTDATQNGIYDAASGAWSRSADTDTWAEFVGAFTFVEGGTVGGGSSWVCNVAAGGTLGVTAVTFAQFGAGATYTGGALVSISGSTIAVKTSGTTPAEDSTAGAVGSADAAAHSDHSHPVKKAIRKTGVYTAQHGDVILADSSGGAFQIDAPPGGAVGQWFWIIDPTGSWATNNVTLGRNSQTIQGLAEDMALNIAGAAPRFIHDGTTWRLS